MTKLPTTPEDIERLQARVETLEEERRHLLAIIEILREIGGAVHYVDIVQAVTRRLGSTFGLDRCSIFLAERGGGTVHLVASYEDPAIRNHVVDLGRYPELKRALETGRTVNIADALLDPALAGVVQALDGRRVKSITVVPITWRGVAIGAIFLRTYRDSMAFSDTDVEFVRVVAELTARALRIAYRFERMRARSGTGASNLSGERERAAMIGFLRRLLDRFAARDGAWSEGLLARASAAEIDRLVEVALTVVHNEAQGR